ncbi:MAG: hypothetical protein HY043_12885 [Verrucomicrobia bacterium]|nr:hypothetical protein [Verrucomicrobiota bacterium]
MIAPFLIFLGAVSIVVTYLLIFRHFLRQSEADSAPAFSEARNESREFHSLHSTSHSAA